MKKYKVILGALCIAVWVVFFVLILPGFINAKKNGDAIGNTIGNTVGNAVGSFEGVTTGTMKGSSDGKTDGKSAEDTEITDMTGVKKIGRLDILSADLKAENIHSYGEDSKENISVELCKYAAIRVYEGKGIFSVDLSKVDFSKDGQVVTVTIPSIDVKIYVDDSKTKTLTEWKSSFFNGKAEDGFDAEGNTEKELKEKLLEKIKQSPALKEQAIIAVENQVTLLVKAASKDKVEVKIKILDEEIKSIEDEEINDEAKESTESEG